MARPGRRNSITHDVAVTAVALALAAQAQATDTTPPAVVNGNSIVSVQAEEGLSGTPNWGGEPLVESNANLIHQQAYGTPGARSPGEWEELIRTDPDVATALEFTAAQLRDARVDVKPAEAEGLDPKVAQAQADFVRWTLLEQLEPGWAEVVQQFVRRGLGVGFSIHEKVEGLVRHPALPGGLGWTVVKLAERLPVSVMPNGWIEENGELKVIRQQGQKGNSWAQIDLPASKVLLHTWNRSGNNYPGFSAFRPVWYLCKIRQDIARLFGISTSRESAGIPTAVATDPKSKLDGKQRKSLEKLLRNLVFHESASVVMPAGWDLKWVFSPGANKGHVVELYNALGQLILRQVQGQQIALGSGETGSRSVGEVHNQAADAFAQGVCASIEGVVNGIGRRPYTGLARYIVERNWGPQPAYPVVSLTLKKAKLATGERAQAVKTYVDAGLITVTVDDENVAREDVGLSPIDPAVREAEKAKKAALAQQIAGAVQAPAQDDEKKPAPFPQAKKLSMAATSGVFTPTRALRASERCLDLNRMASFLDAARDDFEHGVRPIVVAMLAKQLPAIKAAMADGDPSEVGDLVLDTKQLDRFIGDYLERARAEGYRQVQAERNRGVAPGSTNPVHFAAEEEQDDQKAHVAEAEEHVETLLDAQRKQLVKRMQARLQADLEAEAIDVVRTGGDAVEVVTSTVQSQLEQTTGFKNDAGLVLTKAWNLGRDQFARERAEQVEEVELSAVLDDGTCDECLDADGTKAEFGSAEHDAFTPPLRACSGKSRCRCLLVYQFKRGSEEVDDDA